MADNDIRAHNGFKTFVAIMLVLVVLLLALLDAMLIYGAVKVKDTTNNANQTLQSIDSNLNKLNSSLNQAQTKLPF